jgi:hypothetical protein
MQNFGDAFWLSVITMVLGAIALCVKSALASKCSNTDLCFGCIKIVRDVQVEEDIELGLNRLNPPLVV